MQIRFINTYEDTDAENGIPLSWNRRFRKMYRMSQAVGAGRGSMGSNLPSLCIESALAHGGPDYALPVQ